MGTTYLIANPTTREYFDLDKGPMFNTIFPEPNEPFNLPDRFGTVEAFALVLAMEFSEYYTQTDSIELVKAADRLAASLWKWIGQDQVIFMSEHDHDAWFAKTGDYMKETGSRYG